MKNLYKSYCDDRFHWRNSKGEDISLLERPNYYYISTPEVFLSVEKEKGQYIKDVLEARINKHIGQRYERLATLIRSGQLNQG